MVNATGMPSVVCMDNTVNKKTVSRKGAGGAKEEKRAEMWATLKGR
jgi:hypothetical protein